MSSASRTEELEKSHAREQAITVGEFMEKLRAMPPELKLLRADYEYGYGAVQEVKLEEARDLETREQVQVVVIQ